MEEEDRSENETWIADIQSPTPSSTLLLPMKFIPKPHMNNWQVTKSLSPWRIWSEDHSKYVEIES